MGCGASTPEDRRNREIAKKQKEAKQKDEQIYKLLLLGAGESGKSTLFKQMTINYKAPYTSEEKERYARIIMDNIHESLLVLSEEVKKFGGMTTEEGKAAHAIITDETTFSSSKLKENLPHLKAFWNDASIQNTWSNRSGYQINDSTSFFLNQLDEIFADGWTPSNQDILHSRVRTTGIVENQFVIQGNKFNMFDVGGQRNERKKWIHFFEGVHILLFVTAISEFDQVLYEDGRTSRVQESIKVFESVANNHCFQKSDIILFLNKEDLFREKVRVKRISDTLSAYTGPEYTDGTDIDEFCAQAQDSFSQLFLSRMHDDEKKSQVKVFLTMATDSANVKRIFDTVRQQVCGAAVEQLL
jgi:GTPase SAR1 family protein